MNKHILLILAICTITMPLFSAVNSGFYFKTGFTFSGLESEDLDQRSHDHMFDGYILKGGGSSLQKSTFEWMFSPLPGMFPSFTVGYEKSFNKVFSISAGLGYRRGTHTLEFTSTEEYHSESASVYYDETEPSISNDFSYLVVPIDFKAMAPTKSGGIYLTVGPEIRILLTAKNHFHYIKYEDNSIDVSGSSNIRDEYKTIGLALGIRLGGEITVKNHAILLESGYDIGISNVSDTPQIATAKTSVLTLFSIGFRLGMPTAE